MKSRRRRGHIRALILALVACTALAAPAAAEPGADYPQPSYTAPTTIQVVRPERTIGRNVDEVLPVVLSSAALLLALGGCAFLLTASIRRRRLGSSH
jgi:hypothetical protein